MPVVDCATVWRDRNFNLLAVIMKVSDVRNESEHEHVQQRRLINAARRIDTSRRRRSFEGDSSQFYPMRSNQFDRGHDGTLSRSDLRAAVRSRHVRLPSRSALRALPRRHARQPARHRGVSRRSVGRERRAAVPSRSAVAAHAACCGDRATQGRGPRARRAADRAARRRAGAVGRATVDHLLVGLRRRFVSSQILNACLGWADLSRCLFGDRERDALPVGTKREAGRL